MVTVGLRPLTPDQVVAVARDDAAVELAPEAVDAMAASRAQVELEEKEGLALINGTDGMLAMLLLSVHDLQRIVTTADIAAAMSVEAALGTDRVYDDDLQQLRPQPGQALSAANMRAVLAGS